MTIARYFLWFAIAAVWFAALSAVQYPLRKRCGVAVRVIVIVSKFLIGTVVAFLIMAGESSFLYAFGFELAALYAALIADAAADVFTLPFVIKKRKTSQNPNRLQVVVSALCVMVYLVFGTVNMQIVSANRFTVESEKLDHNYKIVFVADLHVGSSQSMETTEKTIKKVDSENADLVFLGGDIVDEFTTKEEMEKTFSVIGGIGAPVYYIYGNHDFLGYAFTSAELETALKNNGITILKDEWIEFSDDLVLFGRDAYNSAERKQIEEIPKRPDDVFVLSADHSPYLTDDIIKSGADLQLSGHSHAGQLFPLRLVYAIAGYDAYGHFRHGNTDLYVSSGASGWSFPFRTEAFCHYDVITLKTK